MIISAGFQTLSSDLLVPTMVSLGMNDSHWISVSSEIGDK
ncbi:hypothetical protein AVEN_66722-1, partial [Araneus ventricosus]